MIITKENMNVAPNDDGTCHVSSVEDVYDGDELWGKVEITIPRATVGSNSIHVLVPARDACIGNRADRSKQLRLEKRRKKKAKSCNSPKKKGGAVVK